MAQPGIKFVTQFADILRHNILSLIHNDGAGIATRVDVARASELEDAIRSTTDRVRISG